MTNAASSPLLDPNAEITHAAVRRALPDALWALYGRTRAGLGGLTVGYVWRGETDGWTLAVSGPAGHIAGIVLTADPLVGTAAIAPGEETALLARPELLPEARSALEVAALEGGVRQVRWPLRTDADILGFLSLVRAKAGT